MKKLAPIYIVIYSFCIIAMANAQTIYYDSDVECSTRSDVEYCTTIYGTPISGITKKYYETGALKAESNWKDGKQDGLVKFYYESGKLEAEGNFKDYKPNGLAKQYYESGKLKAESNWKDGKQDGLFKFYYESGALKSESNWKDGKQNGLRKEYYESGKLKSESNWKDGKQNGLTKQYYESGALEAEGNFKDDKQNGLAKHYYESGALETEANWKDGKPNGLTKGYYESGALEAETNWKDGKQDGLTKEYYESGKLKAESNWKDGKQDGLVKFYYESGALKSESNWKDDKPNGLAKHYYESGVLGMEENYLFGKLLSQKTYDEVVFIYDEYGNLTVNSNAETKNPHMIYADNNDISQYITQFSKRIDNHIFKNANALDRIYEISQRYSDYFTRALKELWDYNEEMELNYELRCSQSHKEKKNYYEYNEDCKRRFLSEKDRLYMLCAQQTANMSGPEKMFYFNQECIENISNNGYLERCKERKEKLVDTCDGEAEFLVKNGYDDLIMVIPSFKQPSFKDIPYPRVVKALYEKYGAAKTSKKDKFKSDILEIFYWVDGDWILRVELTLNDDKFNNSTEVSYISSTYINPKAYTAQEVFLKEEKQRKEYEAQQAKLKEQKEKERRINNFKL